VAEPDLARVARESRRDRRRD